MTIRLGALPRVSLAALAMGLAATPVAAQQDTGGSDAAAADGGEIVVTGSIIQAQIASNEQKRAALNLVDIAAADAVGRFPDQNSAAALSRLPAVAVQRDQGQERYIQVRGAPNRWTSVLIDGVPMVGVDEGGDSRAFRFDAVPAVLLSSLAVNKSLTPAIPADAIVASIDLKTFSPMDQQGFSATGDLGYGFMDLGGGEQRQGSLRLSWSNDTIGVVVGGSHYRRKQLTDNREVGLFDAPSSPTDVTFGPTEIDIRQYQIERWSNGLFGSLEARPADGQRFFLTGIFTEFNDNERRNQYELRLDRATAGFRNFDAGDLANVPLRGTFNFGEYRNRNYIGTLGSEIETDSGIDLSLRLNYARSDNDTDLPLIQASTTGLASPSLTYDRSDPRFPIVTLYQTVAGTAPGSFARGPLLTNFNQATLNPATAIYIAAVQRTVSDSYTAKFDIGKQFDKVRIDAGALWVKRDISGNNFSFANVGALGALGTAVGAPFNINDYVTSTPWDTGFPLGFTLNYVDNTRMRADALRTLAALEEAGRFDPANNIPARDRYEQQEKMLAGYVMATAELDRLTLVGGLRVERYTFDNAGIAQVGTALVPLEVRSTKTDFFPSLNARFELNEDLIFRLSGQRGISRPAYGAIRVGSSINDTASPGTITGGNPALRPEYTWGVDTSLEYYLPEGGIASVAGFYRWVDNVYYQNTQPVGSAAFNSGSVDRSAYLLSSIFNGENGKLYGVEFNYQQRFAFLPSPLDGFGFQGNLTLLGGTFDTATVNGRQITGIAFPGRSKTIYNASLFYEKYGLSARVSYQWRDDWLDSIGGLGAGESRQAYGNLDVTVRYKINDMFTVFADAANLTNEQYIAYEGDPNRISEVEQIGSRYLFGVRFNF